MMQSKQKSITIMQTSWLQELDIEESINDNEKWELNKHSDNKLYFD